MSYQATSMENIEKFRRSENDTGSPEVQIALLTARIKHLTNHFKMHNRDFHSKYGLQNLVSLRRKLLVYLKRKRFEQYKRLIADLGLRDSY